MTVSVATVQSRIFIPNFVLKLARTKNVIMIRLAGIAQLYHCDIIIIILIKVMQYLILISTVYHYE